MMAMLCSLVAAWLMAPPEDTPPKDALSLPDACGPCSRGAHHCDGVLTTTTLSGLNFDIGGLDLNQKTSNSYPQMKEQLRTTTFLVKDKCIRS